jgi:hypothetical protein
MPFPSHSSLGAGLAHRRALRCLGRSATVELHTAHTLVELCDGHRPIAVDILQQRKRQEQYQEHTSEAHLCQRRAA